VQFILGICLFVIAAGFTSYSFYMHSIIREAARNTRVTRMMDRRRNTSYSQSVEGFAAGRDVVITLIAHDKLEEWTHSFWRGPLGALIVAVGATIIAAVFMKFTGLTQ